MTQFAFQAHVDLLRLFLARRAPIVERIQNLLAAQQKPPQGFQDHTPLSRQFENCFFAAPVTDTAQNALRGQLQQAHWSSGFKPRVMPGIPNEMFDPADLVTRAVGLWNATRWPGRNGRLRFAQTLFNVFVVRCIALLDMRLWDAEAAEATQRLAQVQGVLDELWKSSPPDQPVLVRDARWLVPVAQSPTTDALAPYFEVAEKIAGSLSAADRLEIHKAAVAMAGGHLRSQLRHFNMQGTALDDHALLLSTRRSNALDCAMTIQGLVPLLQAHARAGAAGDERRRRELAGIILQGISPDPELFVNRTDLLRAYSMIEHLFVAVDPAGTASYTPMGQRHLLLVDEYVELLAQQAAALFADHAQFRPVAGAYSPYGVLFGFSSNLIEHMTMKALQTEAETRFSLEDVFAEHAGSDDRLAWVSGWRQLPHISESVQKLYAYPQSFAETLFERIGNALSRRVARDHAGNASSAIDPHPVAAARPGELRTGRLFVASTQGEGSTPIDHSAGEAADTPELSVEYVLSSDQQLVAEKKAVPCEQQQILLERNEGEFLVSYQTPGGWTAISKDLLTDVLGAGRDARVAGLPTAAQAVLRLMCPGLLAG